MKDSFVCFMSYFYFFIESYKLSRYVVNIHPSVLDVWLLGESRFCFQMAIV